MLDEVGIEDGERRLRQYPHELSGGMLQRVMIGAALLTEPRLLLADEPTTALDVTTQAEVMAILDELRRDRGLALLFITHDLELASAVCDRTTVMYAGEVMESQPAARLHDDPWHPYSAALVAARPRIDATGRAARRDSRPAAVGVRGARRAARSRPAACTCRTAAARRTRELRPSPAGVVRCIRAEEIHATLAAGACLRPDAVVEVEGLRKEFGQLVAVDDVSFRVEAGRSLAVVGESGSGKTTVARMIVGLERPTAGVIRALGRDRSTPGPRRRRATQARRRGADRLPGPVLQPRPAPDGRTARSTRCCGCIAAARATSAAAACSSWPSWSGWTSGRRGRCRGGCRAASASASRSPGRWRPSRRC